MGGDGREYGGKTVWEDVWVVLAGCVSCEIVGFPLAWVLWEYGDAVVIACSQGNHVNLNKKAGGGQR